MQTKWALTDKIGAEISEAFGLKHVRCLDIHIEKGKIVTVTAQFHCQNDGMAKAATILKRYELQEIEA